MTEIVYTPEQLHKYVITHNKGQVNPILFVWDKDRFFVKKPKEDADLRQYHDASSLERDILGGGTTLANAPYHEYAEYQKKTRQLKQNLHKPDFTDTNKRVDHAKLFSTPPLQQSSPFLTTSLSTEFFTEYVCDMLYQGDRNYFNSKEGQQQFNLLKQEYSQWINTKAQDLLQAYLGMEGSNGIQITTKDYASNISRNKKGTISIEVFFTNINITDMTTLKCVTFPGTITTNFILKEKLLKEGLLKLDNKIGLVLDKIKFSNKMLADICLTVTPGYAKLQNLYQQRDNLNKLEQAAKINALKIEINKQQEEIANLLYSKAQQAIEEELNLDPMRALEEKIKIIETEFELQILLIDKKLKNKLDTSFEIIKNMRQGLSQDLPSEEEIVKILYFLKLFSATVELVKHQESNVDNKTEDFLLENIKQRITQNKLPLSEIETKFLMSLANVYAMYRKVYDINQVTVDHMDVPFKLR